MRVGRAERTTRDRAGDAIECSHHLSGAASMHMTLQIILIATLLVLLSAAPTTAPSRPAPAEPAFVDLPAMQLAGVATYGHPSDGSFAKLWSALDSVVQKSEGLRTERYAYGVEMYPPTWQADQKWGYLVGCEVADASRAPTYLVRCELPAGTYAVFRVPGGIDGIPDAYRWIYHTWLPISGYALARPLDVERHVLDPNVKPPAEHVVEILIPVKKKP
jgi:predicted transcriptional regulator YdeE